ncbi:MAG: 2-oxoacid:acceptor oxidoreductase subunit alpha [Nitrospinae bacterium]|nr:2-oxoacid:acceptor oxidoreductase subunit alpha [Nitrospinota bacterium]
MQDVAITIGGAAGQGLVTISDMLLKLLSRTGRHVFAIQDYMSRVRGGHNFMRIRISGERKFANTEKTNILVALDQRTVVEHLESLEDPALVLHDTETVGPVDAACATFVGIPISASVPDGNKVFGNSVAFGAVISILGLDLEPAKEIISQHFGGKGREAVEKNLRAAAKGYAHIKSDHAELILRLPDGIKKPAMLINGAEALGLGMIAGGLRFISAYPMSPSTSIFNYVTRHAGKLGILSEQAEDEIASVNMALGASAAGARAATTTSGGGLDLMAEGISLAGISETPVVINNIQRPGPATGQPTRTAQEDLDLVLNMGHGEFPRFVFAPGTAEEAFYTAAGAMNLADKYQVPVFILGDQLLVDSYTTLPGLDLEKAKYQGHLADPAKVARPYKRYLLTPDGVSPRLPYGAEGARVMFDSHLHDETGLITEEPAMAKKMTEKRFLKLRGMSREPFRPVRYGHKKPEMSLVCWGSTYGAVREAVDLLNAGGARAEMIHFNRLSPFPVREAVALLRGKKSVRVVEGNHSSQLGRLIARETSIKTGESVLRYDGRPFTASYVIENLKRVGKWKLKMSFSSKAKRRGARGAATSASSRPSKRR